MVPDVADENAIDRSVRQQRVVQVGQDRDDVGRVGFAYAPVDVADHVGADVDGVDFALVADKVRQAECEIARAGADVGDRFAGLDVERAQDLMRFLIFIALGVL